MALDDLLQNVLSYAWPDRGPGDGAGDGAGEGADEGSGSIELTVSRGPDGLTLVMRDDGRPFDPCAAPEADTSSSLDERDIGGLGLHLIHKTMDRVDYQRVDDHNVLTLLMHPPGSD